MGPGGEGPSRSRGFSGHDVTAAAVSRLRARALLVAAEAPPVSLCLRGGSRSAGDRRDRATTVRPARPCRHELSLSCSSPPPTRRREHCWAFSIVRRAASFLQGRPRLIYKSNHKGNPWPVCLVNHKPYYDHSGASPRWGFPLWPRVAAAPQCWPYDPGSSSRAWLQYQSPRLVLYVSMYIRAYTPIFWR